MTAALPLFLAATCVTHVEQKGPEGPWVGEVQNQGDQTIHGGSAVARLYDADGYDLYANVGALTCPSRLLPGEVGAFELFAEHPHYPPRFKEGTPTLPLRAEFFRIEQPPVGTGQARGDGLYVREVERVPGQKRVRIELINNSTSTYSMFTVCGVLRDHTGKLLEVARADGPHLPFTLFPGEAHEMDLYFHSFEDGVIRYHALGIYGEPYPDCCPVNGPSNWRSVDTGPFSVLLPPDWTYEPGLGIDSFVGAFVGDGITLHFDYGFHSDPLTSIAAALHDVHLETIGGRSAKVVRYNTEIVGPHTTPVTGVHFFEVTRETVGLEQLPVRLTVSAVMAASDRQAIAFHIFRSIRFDAP